MLPTSLAAAASCLSDYDPDALPVEQAQQFIQQCISPVSGIERLALRSALGRVLAEDIISPINVPAHDNSAMDGYALRGADLKMDRVLELRIVGSAFAGSGYLGQVGAGEAVRIMTGAPMPLGCDTVVPQELVQAATETVVSIPAAAVKPGDNRRCQGEDLRAGAPALLQGRMLRPADLGLLASLGIAEVSVRRRLRVAFFSTGDELRSLGEPLEAGCVYDSNRYTLYGMLERLGCDLVDMGVVRDDPVALESALRTACENADVVITSGGVSVGEADYTKAVMEKLGDVLFWKIAMRPGRPMAFGRIASGSNGAWLFGLPGNPVAVMVTFYFFARAALTRMMGNAELASPLLQVMSQSDIRKKPGRTEYQRGILSREPGGRPQVRLTGSQGSGILRSMSEANCIVVLAHDQGNVKAGEMVDVLVFDGLV